jgi:hypothetical protein
MRSLRRPKSHVGYLSDGVALCGAPISRALDDEERKRFRMCRRCARRYNLLALKDEIMMKVTAHVRIMNKIEEAR